MSLRRLLVSTVLLLGCEAAFADTQCESTGGYRECRIGSGGKVRLVMDLSQGRLCEAGVTWGTAKAGVVWVDGRCKGIFAVDSDAETAGAAPKKPSVATVDCASKGAERQVCEADTKLGVALVRVSGPARCALDETWGFDDRGVWVSEGCGGTFALGGFRIEESAVPKTALRTRCESKDGAPGRCPVEGVRGVGLVRQLGKDDCVLNRSWGYDKDGIWVRNGCAAEFAVVR